MDVLDQTAKELFGDPDERGEFEMVVDRRKQFSWYEPDELGSPMTLQQLKRLQQAGLHRNGNPNGLRNHPEYDDLYEVLEDVKAEWPSVEIKMNGSLYQEDEWWVETVNLLYDGVENQSEFEEWCVLSFKSSLREETKGVSPTDDRVTITNSHFRYSDDDENLLATTDEFGFEEDPKHGKFVRLWWDD